MKLTYLIVLALILAATITGGCDTIGSSPSAPTKLEQAIYTIHTNYVDVPMVITNQVVSIVVVTNVDSQVVTHTNTAYETVTVTNQVQAVTLTPSDATKQAVDSIGAVTNLLAPGAGTLASGIFLTALSIWGHLRSYKRGSAASTLTQEVEVLREFIKTLPAGVKYDTAITSWLQAHQLETGTANLVLKLVSDSVDNPAAKEAALAIRDTLATLGVTPPATPPQTPAV